MNTASLQQPDTLGALAVLVPLVACAVAVQVRMPSRRAIAAAVLATLWNVPALIAVDALAAHQGWWHFTAHRALVLGTPPDLLAGWALLWGALPMLVAPRRWWLVPPVCAAFDAAFMPRLGPVLSLGPAWWMGEALAIATALLPALLLGHLTVRRQLLAVRASMQGFLATALLAVVIPLAALEHTPHGIPALLGMPQWELSLTLQAIAVPGLLSVAALQEFVQRGGGTPFPYDPPQRLVWTGPYAYVANPMQLSLTLVVAVEAALLRNGWIALVAAMSVVYSAGLAHWHEECELSQRFGEGWDDYRRAVRVWLPRWRPAQPPGPLPILYVAATCAQCSPVRAWFERRRPTGLAFEDAENAPGPPLRRITYEYADGHRESGVRAVAAALQHLTLAWAAAGWVLRLPVVASFVQILLDGCGAGPRTLAPPGGSGANRYAERPWPCSTAGSGAPASR